MRCTDPQHITADPIQSPIRIGRETGAARGNKKDERYADEGYRRTAHLHELRLIVIKIDVWKASASIVDDEGVDLVLRLRDSTATLAVQVKARMTDTSVARQRVAYGFGVD